MTDGLNREGWVTPAEGADGTGTPKLADVIAERDKYRNWLDDFTHVVIDVTDRAGLVRAARSLRRKAGMEEV